MSKYINIVWIFMVLVSCTEEIPIATEVQSDLNIEEILIVEATLTDEVKQQQVLLSRGVSFANDSVANFERNAQIAVVDEMGTRFDFIEFSPGDYRSEVPFGAQQDMEYQLQITTQDGVQYQSETVAIVGNSVIDNLYAERIISDNEVEGMAIFVDSSNPDGELNDYQYTFEETYQIIAPNWTSSEFEIITEGGVEFNESTGEFENIYPDVRLVPREQEEQVCYNTVPSQGVILSDGAALTNNQKARNMVRFISRDNAIISHRYSILVRQLLQTQEAANFYRTILQFSQNESLFSEVQPGLIEGNIVATNNSEATVIGFFGVASVVESRLFFNYEDFFPDEPLPPYFDGLNCEGIIAPVLQNPDRDGPIPENVTCGQTLIELIGLEQVEFFEFNSNPPGECQGPYFVTLRACGDCTALGSNLRPEFWID